MMTMEIEVVDLRKVSGAGKIRAFVDVKFGDAIIVRGFTVLDGKNGLLVSMPKKATKDGRWVDVLVAITEETKISIEDAILEAYDRETDGA